MPPRTLNTETVRLMLPLLAWRDSAKYVFPVLASTKGRLEPVTLTAVGTVMVTVPAGTFEC